MNFSDSSYIPFTKEQVELYIKIRDDYSFYLTYMGFEDTPISLAVHEGYFNSNKSTIVMEPFRGCIFKEIKYKLNKLDTLFGDGNYIEINQITKIVLKNRSYFIAVREPLDMKGRSYSHLIVSNGFQNHEHFDSYIRPVAAACSAKISIVP